MFKSEVILLNMKLKPPVGSGKSVSSSFIHSVMKQVAEFMNGSLNH